MSAISTAAGGDPPAAPVTGGETGVVTPANNGATGSGDGRRKSGGSVPDTGALKVGESKGPLTPYKTSEAATTGGVFISPDSLTFPTAAAVCAALVNSFGVFWASASHNVWVVLGIAALVGGIIIVVGWPADGSTNRQKIVYVVTGILNILLLFASVMGLTSMATQKVPGLPASG